MAGKKHPILTVLVILAIVALILGGSMALLLKFIPPFSSLSFKEKIGVIQIEGVISDSNAVLTQLVKFRKDSGIKAIILRINSPGGGVAPSQEIYREVQKTIQTKKVIASMGSVAASGGYYIAAAASKIVASPGTITGSIGVLMEFVRFEELLDKIGITLDVIKSGEFKDIGSPHRKLTQRDRELLDAMIASTQKQFVEAIANGRSLSVDKVNQIADGRIFTGAQAKELGLIDVLGNFQDAVAIAKDLAGIKGDVTLVYPTRSKLELWDLLTEKAAGTLFKLMKNTQTLLEYRWSASFGD